jgi:hypothetical protein
LQTTPRRADAIAGQRVKNPVARQPAPRGDLAAFPQKYTTLLPAGSHLACRLQQVSPSGN